MTIVASQTNKNMLLGQKVSKERDYYTKKNIDKKGSFTWLQNGIPTYNEERLIIAAQDQGIVTNGLKMFAS